MDKYMKKSDVIAYIRNEAKEAQSEFEELGGESGIIAEAFCSICGEKYPTVGSVPNYFPNCGAKMDGAE